MSQIVSVALGSRSYSVHVGPRLLSQAGTLLAPFSHGVVPLVTDENVAGLHLDMLMESLSQQNIDARPIVLPPGEGTKNFSWLEKICRELIHLGVDRRGLIVAFGGGVIGDLVGFAAGILKRGVNFAQLPTTLLAQVDSSVGGKTAIDVPEGKNLVGLFHQPRIVIADTSILSTLPRRELLAGYAEVVKYGALGDPEFFSWLETNGVDALDGNETALEYVVTHSCRLKAGIVSRDEREAGDRALLNLGHTFAHALEATVGYSEQLLHGEAVAIGMVLAFRLSEHLGHCGAADTQRLVRHLRAVGLPTEIRSILRDTPDPDTILDHMRHDKKADGNKLAFILVHGLGHAFVGDDVPPEAVRTVLAS